MSDGCACSRPNAALDAEELEAVLNALFGPGGQVALIQQPTGCLNVSRSGWAVLKAVFEESSSTKPIHKILLNCAGNVESSFGDGVKCFVFTVVALLKNLQNLKKQNSELVCYLGRMQIALAQLNYMMPGDSSFCYISSGFEKVTHMFFYTRFPILVSSVLEKVFNEWLVLCLSDLGQSELHQNLQYLHKNFPVLCYYQHLGSRPISNSKVQSGFLVSRAMIHTSPSDDFRLKLLHFGENGDSKCDHIDIELEVNRFLDDDDLSGTLLITSANLSDLLLFRLRLKGVAILHCVPTCEIEYIYSVLHKEAIKYDVKINVKSVVEGTNECTWLMLPHVHQLILCGPTDAVCKEYAAACHSVLKVVLNTAQHKLLIKAGGCFERALHQHLTYKIEKYQRRPTPYGIVNRRELLIWHKNRQSQQDNSSNAAGDENKPNNKTVEMLKAGAILDNENTNKEMGDELTNKVSVKFSTLHCNEEKHLCQGGMADNKDKCLEITAESFLFDSIVNAMIRHVDDDMLGALAGALLAVPHKLSSKQCQQEDVYESFAFKVGILQHVIDAAIEILRIDTVVRKKPTEPHTRLQ